jgi:hypothetical protein
MQSHPAIAIGIAVCAGALLPSAIQAEEGGSGHYFPGAMSSFMDSVPTKEGFVVRYNFLHYDGDVSVTRNIPVARLVAAGLSADSWGHGLTFLSRPPLDLGDRWSYALSATVPFISMDVSASLTEGPVTVRRSSSLDALGDIVLMPLMLNYNISPNLNVNFRGAVYAPTGDYEVGRLANTGKNFWTIEPTVGLVYLGMTNGIEASLYLGADFNTENPDTDYQSGSVFHLDGTLAQHFRLAGGLAGLGVNGFWYDQFTGDSGAGAILGSFESMTTGVGPVISYVFKLGKVDLVAEAKWLKEIETDKRLKGDTFWFKLGAKF